MVRLTQWLKRVYRQSSIQLVISVSFTVVAVIGMTFMGVTLFMRFSTLSNEISAQSSRQMIEQVNLNLDSYLRNMMRISDTMFYRVIKNVDLSEASFDEPMNMLYGTYNDIVVSIAVFSHDGSLVTATPLAATKQWIVVKDQEWFRSAINKIENLHFSTPHVQNLFLDPDNRYRWVVSLSRHVELTRDGATESGVLLVDMNFGGIEQILKNAGFNKSGYIYLMDGNGEIIYHPRQQLLYSGIAQENNAVAASYEDGSHQEQFNGSSRLVTLQTVGYTGWKIVGVTPLDSVTSDMAQIRLFAVFIVLFSIFLMVMANIVVSSRIAVPVKKLDDVVKLLESGAENLIVPEEGCYEVQHLGRSIRSMVDTMQQLMEDIVVQQEQKRKSELDVLHAQINPHFLYNTLDSIVWMIEKESNRDAVTMVSSLARLFRISLSGGRNIITVEEELEHAAHYLTIQKMRYKNKFTTKIVIEEQAKGLSSVKLVVQPLLENAIYHGMEFMDGEGEILIHAYCQEDVLVIDVTDNGLGMSQKTVQELLTAHYTPTGKGSGIGVRNVHERVRLTFGNQYGLVIASEPDEGTTVSVRMPQIHYQQPNRRVAHE